MYLVRIVRILNTSRSFNSCLALNHRYGNDDDTGYCGPYGLAGSCNVYQNTEFCRGALGEGNKWCDVTGDPLYGANRNRSQLMSESPGENGFYCSTGAYHTIQDSLGMVKCKSAYSKEHIPSNSDVRSILLVLCAFASIERISIVLYHSYH